MQHVLTLAAAKRQGVALGGSACLPIPIARSLAHEINPHTLTHTNSLARTLARTETRTCMHTHLYTQTHTQKFVRTPMLAA